MVHYFVKDGSNFDKIEEEESENDSKGSSASSLELPIDESNLTAKEIKQRKQQAQKPINNIGRNNYQMQMRQESFSGDASFGETGYFEMQSKLSCSA